MPSWNELLSDFNAAGDDAAKGAFLQQRMVQALADIGRLRGDRHVLLYGSAFLQKGQVPAQQLMIIHEDLNGLMSAIYGMDWDKGLTLILHTSGGSPNAAESLVDYLRSKFDSIEVIVPTLAMSAGTMISLAMDRVVMGRQSQLGPIDPQMGSPSGRSVSARAIVEQFDRAAAEVAANAALARAWAPILQSLGPALLQEAQNALDYSETMVAGWLEQYMFSDQANPKELGKATAKHFNDATQHKSHGRRINRDEARANNVVVEDLEDDQDLQEAVLTAYHLMTIAFEQSPSVKFIWTDTGRTWLKNWAGTS